MLLNKQGKQAQQMLLLLVRVHLQMQVWSDNHQQLIQAWSVNLLLLTQALSVNHQLILK